MHIFSCAHVNGGMSDQVCMHANTGGEAPISVSGNPWILKLIGKLFIHFQLMGLG